MRRVTSKGRRTHTHARTHTHTYAHHTLVVRASSRSRKGFTFCKSSIPLVESSAAATTYVSLSTRNSVVSSPIWTIDGSNDSHGPWLSRTLSSVTRHDASLNHPQISTRILNRYCGWTLATTSYGNDACCLASCASSKQSRVSSSKAPICAWTSREMMMRAVAQKRGRELRRLERLDPSVTPCARRAVSAPNSRPARALADADSFARGRCITLTF